MIDCSAFLDQLRAENNVIFADDAPTRDTPGPGLLPSPTWEKVEDVLALSLNPRQSEPQVSDLLQFLAELISEFPPIIDRVW